MLLKARAKIESKRNRLRKLTALIGQSVSELSAIFGCSGPLNLMREKLQVLFKWSIREVSTICHFF